MALACASSSQAIISSANFAASSNRFSRRVCIRLQSNRQSLKLFTARASSEADPDCNAEECAPEKEVGKVSMEWLAEEKTKVVGTFPPRTRGGRGWTGYVEKDTAGQTNIYSVEPAVYVAESAISSGTAGSSSSGAENTAGLVGFIGLIAVASASSILIQVGKTTPPKVQTADYSGPSLTYYINKFKPPEAVETAAPIETENAPPVVTDSATPEAPPAELQQESSNENAETTPVVVQSESQSEPSASPEAESSVSLAD